MSIWCQSFLTLHDVPRNNAEKATHGPEVVLVVRTDVISERMSKQHH